MPQEYSTCGVGDFRLPSIELELANGSHTADMRYGGFRLEKGKYAMEGLPGFYSNEDETETLVITLKDAAAQVVIELYYSIFENYDLITRACLKNHSRDLHSPLCGEFIPNLINIARYAS